MTLLRWIARSLAPGLLCLLGAVPSVANELVGFSEDLPPFAYLENGEHRGLANEVLDRIAQRTGLSIRRYSQPWTRSVRDAQAEPNGLLYVTVRTPEREPQYLWVGPVDGCDLVLMKLRRRSDLRFEPARRSALQIGARRDGPAVPRLREAGVPESDIYQAPSSEVAIRMLYAERLDMLAGLHLPSVFQVQRNGLDPAELHAFHVLQPGFGCYFAFNPRVDEQLLARFRKGFEDLRASGELQALRELYLRDPGKGSQR